MSASFVVNGGGVAAWAAAAMLADALPDARIIVVEEAAAPSSLDIAALPADALLLRLTGVPLDRLMAETGAQVVLGTTLEQWRNGHDVILAAQEPLPAIDGIAVHDLALRAAIGAGRREAYADFHAPFRFQARAAAERRYAPPSGDRRSPRSLLRPGVLIDGAALTGRLRKRALATGATCAADAPASPLLTIETRATGRGAWEPRGDGYDRILALRLGGSSEARLTVRVTPLPSGLMIAAPATDGLTALVLHADDDARAEAMARDALPGLTVTLRAGVDHEPGFDPAPWQGSRLRLGPAAASIGTLAAGDAALLDAQLALLAELLPADASQLPVCAAAYNARFTEIAGHHADFAQLVAMHGPSPCDAPPSPALTRRLDQFLSRNRGVMLDGDPFEAQAWTDAMIALGLMPRRYDPQADRLPARDALAHLGRMVEAFDRTLAVMPRYRG